MNYIVSITSQGQISIPAKIRRELGLENGKKAFVKREGDKLIIEPAMDILEFEGIFKDRAIKGKTIDEIIAMEEKAWEEAAVERYKKKLKNR